MISETEVLLHHDVWRRFNVLVKLVADRLQSGVTSFNPMEITQD